MLVKPFTSFRYDGGLQNHYAAIKFVGEYLVPYGSGPLVITTTEGTRRRILKGDWLFRDVDGITVRPERTPT